MPLGYRLVLRIPWRKIPWWAKLISLGLFVWVLNRAIDATRAAPDLYGDYTVFFQITLWLLLGGAGVLEFLERYYGEDEGPYRSLFWKKWGAVFGFSLAEEDTVPSRSLFLKKRAVLFGFSLAVLGFAVFIFWPIDPYWVFRRHQQRGLPSLVILGVIALFVFLSSRRNKKEQEIKSKQYLRQRTLAPEILKLAQQKGGQLTIVEVMNELRVDIEMAKEVIENLSTMGMVKSERNASGLLVYTFSPQP